MKKYICLTVLALLFSLSVWATDAPVVTDENSIHAEAPLALRVKAEMSLEASRSSSTIEYGFLITRKKLLSSAGLENSSLVLDGDIYYVKGVSRGQGVDDYYAIEDERLYYTGLVRGIPSQYYDDILVVRTYIVMAADTLYGEPIELSLYGTAKQIKENDSLFLSFSHVQKTVINEIIYSVDGYPEPEPEEPKPETDSQLIEMLKTGRDKLKKIRITNAKQIETRNVIVECMSLVVTDAENGIFVDKNYILENYDEYISRVKDLVKVQMTDTERSNFINLLSNTRNVPQDVQDFLSEYFGISKGDFN